MVLSEKIENYRKVKNQLSEVKDLEMVLRLELAQEMGIDSLKAGTTNFDYEEDGVRLKIIKKLNYKLDRDILEMLNLSEEEAECIKWTPELKLTPYRKVGETGEIDKAIMVTDATPTIEIELRDFG
jgi:hypothetical protein